MIAMLIADNPSAERKSLLKEARWQAAKLTEDDWKWIECGTSEELLGLAEDGSPESIAAIREHGLCPVHRASFCSNFLPEPTLF
jgi:hypothetical protein